MCTGLERYSAPVATEHPLRCSVAVHVSTSCAPWVDGARAPSASLAHPVAHVACVILSLTAKLSLVLVGSALVVLGAVANVIGPALVAAGRAAFEASSGGDC